MANSTFISEVFVLLAKLFQ